MTQDIRIFEHWCLSNGVYAPSLSIRSCSAGGGHGLFANESIAAASEFVSVPLKLVLDLDKVRQSQLGRLVAEENERRRKRREELMESGQQPSESESLHDISDRSLFYLYLIHARATPTNFFHPWLFHGVPQSYDLPLFWSDEQLELIRGTNMYEAVTHRRRALQLKWSRTIGWVSQSHPELLPTESSRSFDAWLWAHGTYSSRGFPAQLANAKHAPMQGFAINPHAFTRQADDNRDDHDSDNNVASISDDRKKQMGCLIPYLDQTNHQYAHPITWLHYLPPPPSNGSATTSSNLHPHDTAVMQQRSSSSSSVSTSTPLSASFTPSGRVVFRCDRAIEAGSEVLNNYGAKPNEELLMGYGFTLRDNPVESMMLALAANPLGEIKQKLMQLAGIPLHHMLITQPLPTAAQNVQTEDDPTSSPLPPSLLKALRISVLDDEELQQVSSYWLPEFVPELLTPPVDSSRETQGWSFISHPNEIEMLESLRSLLLGRLARLEAMAANSLPDQTPSTESMEVDDDGDGGDSEAKALITSFTSATSFSDVQAFYNAAHQRDVTLREQNATKKAEGWYRIECALNYRIGQRQLLLRAVEQTERLLRQAASRAQQGLDASNLKVYALGNALRSSEHSNGGDEKGVEAGAAAPQKASRRKKRRTSASAAATSSADVSSATPSSNAVDAGFERYHEWLKQHGGQIDASWTNGCWALQSDHPLPPLKLPQENSSSDNVPTSIPAASPPIMDLPCSLLISKARMSIEDSFSDCMALIEGLEDEQLFILFLLHQQALGEPSPWRPWLDVMKLAVHIVDEEDAAEPDTESMDEHESALYDLYTQLFPQLSESYPELFDPAFHSWSHFRHAALIVQSHRILIRCSASGTVPQPSINVALLPVPCMPCPSPFPLTRIEYIPDRSAPAPLNQTEGSEQDAEDDEGEVGEENSALLVGRVTFRSLVPLSTGHVLTLPPIPSSASPPLLSHGTALMCSSEDSKVEGVGVGVHPNLNPNPNAVTISFAQCIELHQTLRQEAINNGQDTNEDAHRLKVQLLSREHQMLLNKLQVDEESIFTIKGGHVPAVLLAVLRSFFLSSAQLRRLLEQHPTVTSTATPATAMTASSSNDGARVDDSDEEEDDWRPAAMMSEAGVGAASPAVSPSTSSPDQQLPSSTHLHEASLQLLQFLLQEQLSQWQSMYDSLSQLVSHASAASAGTSKGSKRKAAPSTTTRTAPADKARTSAASSSSSSTYPHLSFLSAQDLHRRWLEEQMAVTKQAVQYGQKLVGDAVPQTRIAMFLCVG